MVRKSYGKINTFLKITGYKKGYHTLISRFVKTPQLYDTISIVPQNCKRFTIEGCGEIPIQSNIIYKSYIEMVKYLKLPKDIFLKYKVVVDKKIPFGAGLGGGSSNSAIFMILVNKIFDLGVDIPTLAKIGAKIGADVPFFIYGYDSANVYGFGEIVEPFQEDPFDIELYTPNIQCDTSLVYRTFKENLLDKIEPKKFVNWKDLTTKEILSKVSPIDANDLYKASLISYPDLRQYAKDGWYFSGSGSSFFRAIW